ncbi:tetratricopeptide repeat-containing sulfotransferase family protein [Bowmanella denitrificans]|uniref:tetratricopeptide repeat-containing sulfotransferase family protein n=1 Tax=Bowmanella denitrificans TaxID=366582 RepID=UPI000C9A63E6|nr:tetratricopeptide repeat-containing sulfotransferase family protein [Bowmanella denitrificans]
MKQHNEARHRQLALIRQDVNQGRFSQAKAQLTDLLKADGNDQEAWYLLAVSQRYLGELDDALSSLQTLRLLDPGYGRLYQEMGHCLLAGKETARAIMAYRQAVQFNPALLASWQRLAELLPESDPGHQLMVANVRELKALPIEIQSATSMLHEGKLLKAEQLCRHYLQHHPRHVNAMRLLAQIGLKHYVLDDAEFLLESCLAFEPAHLGARQDYVLVLHKRQKYQQALQQARTLLDADPDNGHYQILLANQLVAVGQFEQALSLYQQAWQLMPGNAHIPLLQGHALKTLGQHQQAVQAYQQAIEARQDFGDAYWSLANLKTYRFTPAQMADMQSLAEQQTVLPEDKIHLHFALGKAFEDSEEYENAFIHYKQGNSLKKAALHYSAEKFSQEVNGQIQHCDTSLFSSRQGMGCADDAPIFIVGLPRAGSTLLEQILASHSMVDGTMELPNILATVHRLKGRRASAPAYPANLHELSAEQLLELGEAYIRDTRIHRGQGRYFIDKMPNNFRHIGLIQLILPNARIIDARRHPMACCFSGFKQLFAEGQEFSYALSDIAAYYRDYLRLMAHWDKVLPGKVYRLQYEQLVADFESQVRQLLDFLGLPFERACLDFHQTRRAIKTASSEQVRQPLYQSGLEQWRHFSPWLGELQQGLGSDVLADVGH